MRKTLILMMAAMTAMTLSMSSCKEKNPIPEPEPEKAPLELYIYDYGTTWATVHIIPADTSELYFWTVVRGGLETASQAVKGDSIERALDSLWVRAYREGADTVIMRDFLSKGVTEWTVNNNMEPGAEYTLLAVMTYETSAPKSEVYALSFTLQEMPVTAEYTLDLTGQIIDYTATDSLLLLTAADVDGKVFNFRIRTSQLEGTFNLSQMEDSYSFLYNPNEEMFNQAYYKAELVVSNQETEYRVNGFVWLWSGVKYILQIHCPKY